MIKEAKEMATSPPSPHQRLQKTSSIHTCTQTMLLVVCPKSTWLHSRRNPFYNRSRKVNIICTPRHFFFAFLFFANYNHLFREQKQFPNISMLQWRCFRLQGREGYKHQRRTTEGNVTTHTAEIRSSTRILSTSFCISLWQNNSHPDYKSLSFYLLTAIKKLNFSLVPVSKNL